MQPELILKSDVLDILFENRNKNYGAYILRRDYNERVYKALFITFSAVILLTLLSFTNSKEERKHIAPIVFTPSPLPPPKFEEKKKEMPQKKKSSVIKKNIQPLAAIKLTRSVVVPDQMADRIIAKVQDVDAKVISNVNGPGITDPGVVSTTNDPKGTSDAEPVIDVSTPVANPDVLPKFPGGDEAFRHFLEKNLREQNMDDEEEVSVKVQFIVGYDGVITSFHVVQSGGDRFDDEVLRVLKKMPHWIPGRSNGHDVSVYFVVPVKFRVQ